MHKILSGKPVKEAIDKEIIESVKTLKANGKTPTIATFRIGMNDGDIYYEEAISKRAAKFGINHELVVLPEGVIQETAEDTLRVLNNDPGINGIIMLMPFPAGIKDATLQSILNPLKDIDAVNDLSYANLFANKDTTFYACTAESCMEILKYYDIDLEGKQVTIVGRSVRVGKPLLLMMMNANATVTVCHTRTRKEDLEEAVRRADIVVLATGNIEGFKADMFRDGQIILDVGTGTGSDGKMRGDLDVRSIEESTELNNIQYTPVPGGVGTVTTSLLLRNVLKAINLQTESK